MNRIIHCDVDNEFIRGAGVVIGAAGSHDDVELELSFSPMWEGTSKKIVWFDALNEQTVVTALTTDLLAPGNGNLYRVSVPWEAKAVEGDMKLTIRGTSVTGNTETRAVVAATACFKVLPALWDPLAVEGSEPSASVSDQLQQQIEDIKQDIVDAAVAADSKAAAAASASAAAASASNAASSAAQADTSASNSAASAAQAAGSAAQASTSASNAASRASSAATSATQAAGSAFNASTSASNAATSATQAADSASAASSSAVSANASAQSAKQYSGKPPVIQAGTWWTWNNANYRYENTGSPAQGPQGNPGSQGPAGPQGIHGAAVSADGIYAFNIDGNGHLILSYTGSDAPDFVLDANGHLILTIE